eukprot:TRINITY_DN4570_c0_g1_i2.p1 TRINITY_DN4570_c0_g1~~TRINITY_DN4570_c0_g1_i2.p1  ORF type:complete len:631 (-),score=136.61 TRINITY_DN4570_c0_g1_i2:315-2207(-)
MCIRDRWYQRRVHGELFSQNITSSSKMAQRSASQLQMDSQPKLQKLQKTEERLSGGRLSTLIKGFLDIHRHRYVRRLFCAAIIIHLFVLLLITDSKFQAPEIVQWILLMSARAWPFPTFQMSEIRADTTEIKSVHIGFKVFEILILLTYTVDLLPKIFVWKKRMIWKLANIFIVTIMVAQVPLTMKSYLDRASGEQVDMLKWRLCSISLSFLLLFEILSIREQRTIRLNELRKKENELTQRKGCNNEWFAEYLHQKAIEDSGYKKYAWAEIVKHDKHDDCWIVIHGKVYDISQFAKQHPGGSMIFDGAGGDCTSMFESYHPLYMTKAGPPEKYCIGEVDNYEPFYSYDGTFFTTVKERVEKALKPKERRYSNLFFVKAAVILVSFIISFYFYVFHTSYLTAILYGLIGSQLGVNIMHDGNHGAVTDNKFISWLFGSSLDLTFSTSIVYKRSHNFGHHGCVNHLELDRSFDTTYPIYRMSPLQPRAPFHRYQHIYMWFLYSFVNFADLFGTFDELFWMSNYPTRRGYLSKTAYYTHAIVKILWLITCMIIPSYLKGWYTIFPYWCAYMMVMANGYSWFFAVNHWTEEAGQVDNTSIGKTNWGILQVENSSNFAMGSSFWTNLVGGLNYQVG